MAAAGARACAASPELFELLARSVELCGKARYEPAAEKALEAVALARSSTPPQSLVRVYALFQHAECLVAQRGQLFERGNPDRVHRTTYAAEEALCAAAYASQQEALPILVERAKQGTLLPGSVPADEEELYLRLTVRSDLASKADDGARDEEAAVEAARPARVGQRLGYWAALQAACFSLLALYPAVFNTPFPPLRTDGVNAGRDDLNLIMNCVVTAVSWLGQSADAGPNSASTVPWRLGGPCALMEEEKLCYLVTQVLEPTLQDERGRSVPNPRFSGGQLDSPFRRLLHALWHGPQLAGRRRLHVVAAPLLSDAVNEAVERGAADAARRGLATCARAGCGAVESCPKAFKTCARCHSVFYCRRDCSVADWPAHKRECKRIAAGRAA